MERMAISIDIVDGELNPYRFRTRPRNKLISIPDLSIERYKRQVLRFPMCMVDESMRNVVEVGPDLHGSVYHETLPGIGKRAAK